MTTPFEADYGTRQGRIEPTDGPPFEGSFVLQLGHDLPGVIRIFKNGDSHMVAQTAAPLVDLGFE